MYIKDPYICFDNKVSSSGSSSQRNTRSSHQVITVKRSNTESQKHKFHNHSLQYCDVKTLNVVKQHTAGVCSCLRSCGLCTQASASAKYGSRPENILCL